MITTLNSIVNTLCATGVVDFPANYKITNKDHVFVYYIDGEVPEILLSQVSSFTAGSPNEYKINAITESGFNVELRDPYDTASGRKISIRRVLPLTQETDYPPGNDFPASTHERALDKLTAIVQQFNETIKRQIGMPLSEDAQEINLPAYIPNHYLGLNETNDLLWKVGTVAVGNDEIKDSHIDWGVGVDQVSAVDMPIEDSGSIITATEVEGALQENRAALDAEEAALTAHISSDGKEHSDVVLNNTHRVSDGSGHTFINQDVKTTSSPTFANATINGLKTKVIPMGDWNLQTTASYDILALLVSNGVSYKNIRLLDCVLRTDDDTEYFPISRIITATGIKGTQIQYTSPSDILYAYLSMIDTGNILSWTLTRAITGAPSYNNWNNTSYNRGWITIQYLP